MSIYGSRSSLLGAPLGSIACDHNINYGLFQAHSVYGVNPLAVHVLRCTLFCVAMFLINAQSPATYSLRALSAAYSLHTKGILFSEAVRYAQFASESSFASCSYFRSKVCNNCDPVQLFVSSYRLGTVGDVTIIALEAFLDTIFLIELQKTYDVFFAYFQIALNPL